MLRFRSRIDVWVPVVMLVPTVIAGLLITMEYQRAPRGELTIAAVICAAACAVMVWLLAGTHYAVTETELIVRSGPGAVALALGFRPSELPPALLDVSVSP